TSTMATTAAVSLSPMRMYATTIGTTRGMDSPVSSHALPSRSAQRSVPIKMPAMTPAVIEMANESRTRSIVTETCRQSRPRCHSCQRNWSVSFGPGKTAGESTWDTSIQTAAMDKTDTIASQTSFPAAMRRPVRMSKRKLRAESVRVEPVRADHVGARHGHHLFDQLHQAADDVVVPLARQGSFPARTHARHQRLVRQRIQPLGQDGSPDAVVMPHPL